KEDCIWPLEMDRITNHIWQFRASHINPLAMVAVNAWLDNLPQVNTDRFVVVTDVDWIEELNDSVYEIVVATDTAQMATWFKTAMLDASLWSLEEYDL